MKKGLLLVVSGPSGAGKSTLCQSLTKKWANVRYSVSCTTRPARPAEVDKLDYIFLTEADFKKKVDAGEFLEWAIVHDHYYGTLKSMVVNDLNSGLDVVLDVDPVGALSIKKAFPDSVGIFIFPPTWESLERRLRGRASDDEGAITKRLANARKEMSYLEHYDYVIVNRELSDAVEDLSAILRAERRRTFRQVNELNCLKIMEEEKA